MTAYNVVNPASMVAGQPEDISAILANFNTIATVLNGNIDNGNLNPAAAIAAAKLAAGNNGDKLVTQSGIPVWVPDTSVASGELAYAQGVGSVAVTTTPAVHLTLPSIVLDGSTPIVIEYHCPVATLPATAGGILAADLYDNGVKVNTVAQMANSAAVANVNDTLSGRIRLTPSAGTHTYDIRVLTSVSTGTIVAGVVSFIRASTASVISTAPPGALLPTQYGTSLPTSPVNGQEAILVDSLTNPSYQWLFRYNANSTSPYKWEFIGGAPWAGQIDTGQATTSTAYVDLATVGPTKTLPYAGDYIISVGFRFAVGGADNGYMSFAIGATAAADADGANVGSSGAVMAVGRSVFKPGLAAGAAITAKYRTASGTSTTFSYRTLTIQPVRVG